ncbi:hypothetical protein G9A89_021313 [Geosiphon pyriformis]|nr:hypothetical protein G9A89_021313 [Geosiphon pyriformis]
MNYEAAPVHVTQLMSSLPSHAPNNTFSPSTLTLVADPIAQTQQTHVPPSSLHLAVGTTFQTWENVDDFLDHYGREQGFVVRKKRVERDDMRIVRKRTYDCEHGGRYTPKKKAAIHEQRNRTSKRIQCGWHINLSFPKTSTHITVTTFINEHNHDLHQLHRSYNDIRNTTAVATSHEASHPSESPRYRSVIDAASATKNRNLPKAVLDDIEFYTLHGNLGVTTQRQLLKAKYPNHQLSARDVSNAVVRFKGGSDKGVDNDAAKLWIWELARKATQIAVDQQDNTLEEVLRQYIREKEDRVRHQVVQQ